MPLHIEPWTRLAEAQEEAFQRIETSWNNLKKLSKEKRTVETLTASYDRIKATWDLCISNHDKLKVMAGIPEDYLARYTGVQNMAEIGKFVKKTCPDIQTIDVEHLETLEDDNETVNTMKKKIDLPVTTTEATALTSSVFNEGAGSSHEPNPSSTTTQSWNDMLTNTTVSKPNVVIVSSESLNLSPPMVSSTIQPSMPNHAQVTQNLPQGIYPNGFHHQMMYQHPMNPEPPQTFYNQFGQPLLFNQFGQQVQPNQNFVQYMPAQGRVKA